MNTCGSKFRIPAEFKVQTETLPFTVFLLCIYCNGIQMRERERKKRERKKDRREREREREREIERGERKRVPCKLE